MLEIPKENRKNIEPRKRKNKKLISGGVDGGGGKPT
jgi:hypothetical protein